ncbi:pyrroline-5-carboxylate reductase-like [Trichoplusia ni]|uniref:Pyrroline-5-carboxylate reductase n=1 Tax=Trichoplusia ni TaxID=7111 RepID=A0A7E5VUL6_TRINI|nr:pyrroline-5-carboxylate reductase-like [Trichoplusia ni]
MDSNNLNVGFIGGGNMSTAIFKGIIKNESHPPSKIWVSGPHTEKLKYWSEMGANVTNVNGNVLDTCDMIFLGVKVNKLNDVISSFRNAKNISSERTITFVSMLAGVKLEKIEKSIKAYYPNSNFGFIRIMPNTPITVGSGICLYTSGQLPNNGGKTLNKLILLLRGSAVLQNVPESYMDSLGALTACGPAYMYLVIEALADGAVKQGVPRDMAIRHAAEMVVGSGQMVLQSGKHPGQLKDEVCSPGGSTICGIAELENGKLRATLINAIEASTKKNQDLGI